LKSFANILEFFLRAENQAVFLIAPFFAGKGTVFLQTAVDNKGKLYLRTPQCDLLKISKHLFDIANAAMKRHDTKAGGTLFGAAKPDGQQFSKLNDPQNTQKHNPPLQEYFHTDDSPFCALIAAVSFRIHFYYYLMFQGGFWFVLLIILKKELF